jgi:DNA modification methylase
MPASFDMAQSCLARPNPNWSYAFVYKKNVKTNMDAEKTEITREEWAAWSDGVWDFSNPGVGIHTTPFAEELVERFLKIYSNQGDKIIDPFGGSGTTLNTCIDNCRACTIIELEPKYVPVIKERVKWGRQSLGYKYEYKYEDLSKL